MTKCTKRSRRAVHMRRRKSLIITFLIRYTQMSNT
jgi:hypothetical protein